MLEILKENSELVRMSLNILMLLVWSVYLHLLLMNFLRQRQSVILINRGVARGPQARCFVTNMGSEPIYLIAAFVYIDSDSRSFVASVTERDELQLNDLSHPSEATNQGPLNSGEVRDIGDFRTMEKRARAQAKNSEPPESPSRFTVVIVAASGHAAKLVGAYRSFSVSHSQDGPTYVPEQVVAKQIRNLRRSEWSYLLDELI